MLPGARDMRRRVVVPASADAGTVVVRVTTCVLAMFTSSSTCEPAVSLISSKRTRWALLL